MKVSMYTKNRLDRSLATPRHFRDILHWTNHTCLDACHNSVLYIMKPLLNKTSFFWGICHFDVVFICINGTNCFLKDIVGIIFALLIPVLNYYRNLFAPQLCRLFGFQSLIFQWPVPRDTKGLSKCAWTSKMVKKLKFKGYHQQASFWHVQITHFYDLFQRYWGFYIFWCLYFWIVLVLVTDRPLLWWHTRRKFTPKWPIASDSWKTNTVTPNFFSCIILLVRKTNN